MDSIEAVLKEMGEQPGDGERYLAGEVVYLRGALEKATGERDEAVKWRDHYKALAELPKPCHSGCSHLEEALAREKRARAEAVKSLREKGDRGYMEMVEVSKRHECLGFEAKMSTGRFGKPELEAHKQCAQLYGKHLAFYLGAAMLEEQARVADREAGSDHLR